jgi:hypothetical protein
MPSPAVESKPPPCQPRRLVMSAQGRFERQPGRSGGKELAIAVLRVRFDSYSLFGCQRSDNLVKARISAQRVPNRVETQLAVTEVAGNMHCLI